MHAPALSKYGTVGAVAVDKNKNVAAATSTGGTTNKKYGRVGDSPIIGSGTYADNETCAVSCTGHGEFFIRWVAGYDLAALIKYAKMDVVSAADIVINKTLKSVGGSGGLIALDANGNCALPFNSEGMFRGCVTKSGDIHVAIFAD
jgi:beta-aspartyl-peptidase (threonine type)